jgi:hypothetical protein
VEIFYGTPFALKMNKDITATFTDKLASICIGNLKNKGDANSRL